MTIKDIYEKFEKIGVFTFSTMDHGEVHSRMAHLNGYDDKGIYFRTMWNKPYARELMETGKVTLCAITDSRILGHTGQGVPEFPPGYVIRLVGQVQHLSESKVRELAEDNEALQLAVVDMDKYTAMREGNFMIYKAKGEVYDFDFECITREHKLVRERFEFGGVPFNKVGPTITDACIECGLCYDRCSFKAIEKGSPFKVIAKHCDDCGTCLMNCPVEAIELSKAL